MSEKSSKKSVPIPVAAGLTGVALSPYLGLIGQKSIIMDPQVNTNIPRTSLQTFSRLAEPGDVILSSRPGWEGFKFTQSPFTGTDFFHASPVVDRRRHHVFHGRHAVIADAGDYYEKYRSTPVPMHGGKYRFTKSPMAIDHFIGEGYGDLVLMRPANRPSAAQHKAYLNAIGKRFASEYSVEKGLKAILKDLFVPKLVNRSDTAVAKNVLCNANNPQMCTSLPAESFAEAGIAKRIARGKLPSEVLPADFMREGSGFIPVVSHVRQPRAFQSGLHRKFMQIGSRGALGLGMAGSAYGAYEHPEVAGGVAASIGTASLVRKLLVNRLNKKYPNLTPSELTDKVDEAFPGLYRNLRGLGFVYDPLHKTTKQRLRLLRNFSTRTLPVMLASGIGTYVGLRALRNALHDRAGTAKND